LRRTSLSHPHLYRRHWVLQRVGLAGTILSFFFALQFHFVSSNSHSFPSAANNGRVVNETSTLLIGISRPPKLPTVTTDLGTKLGTRLSNGVAIHHCRHGLLPLLAAIPIIANTDQMFLPLLAWFRRHTLSRPAQASLALRPAASLARLKADFCPEASTWPVAQPSRSVAPMPTDNYMGGFLLHKWSPPFRRTVNYRGLFEIVRGPEENCPPCS